MTTEWDDDGELCDDAPERESDTSLDGALLVLAALWMLSKYTFEIAPAMQQQGAKLYDWVYDDAGHKGDLPMNPLSKSKVLEIATNAGFPEPKLAAAIAMAESGGVANALAKTSREYSVGLWQINLQTHPTYSRSDMEDPVKNAAAAFEISKRGTNWRPWGAYTSGKYKQFLTGVLGKAPPTPGAIT